VFDLVDKNTSEVAYFFFFFFVSDGVLLAIQALILSRLLFEAFVGLVDWLGQVVYGLVLLGLGDFVRVTARFKLVEGSLDYPRLRWLCLCHGIVWHKSNQLV